MIMFVEWNSCFGAFWTNNPNRIIHILSAEVTITSIQFSAVFKRFPHVYPIQIHTFHLLNIEMLCIPIFSSSEIRKMLLFSRVHNKNYCFKFEKVFQQENKINSTENLLKEVEFELQILLIHFNSTIVGTTAFKQHHILLEKIFFSHYFAQIR